MSWFEITSEIPSKAVAAVEEVLLEMGVDGWMLREDVIARRAWLVGIFQGDSAARTRLEELKQNLAPLKIAGMSEPALRPIADADWRNSYREHFKAWHFGRLHWVPVWERETFSLPPGDAVLWLDPGLAFGTGNHETTRLCVERLVSLAEHGTTGRVLDVGCGSGILALSAVLLGYRDVSGFDNDPEAIRVSEENAVFNGCSDRVRFFVADVTEGLAGSPANLVLANIQADVLIRYARELVAAVAPGGALVLSGILAGENAEVRNAFEQLTPKWTLNARVMGEWSDVLLVRPE